MTGISPWEFCEFMNELHLLLGTWASGVLLLPPAMGGCYGWLLWVVAMGGCYGWCVASTPLSNPCGFEPSRVLISGATSFIFHSDPRGGPPDIIHHTGIEVRTTCEMLKNKAEAKNTSATKPGA